MSHICAFPLSSYDPCLGHVDDAAAKMMSGKFSLPKFARMNCKVESGEVQRGSSRSVSEQVSGWKRFVRNFRQVWQRRLTRYDEERSSVNWTSRADELLNWRGNASGWSLSTASCPQFFFDAFKFQHTSDENWMEKSIVRWYSGCLRRLVL